MSRVKSRANVWSGVILVGVLAVTASACSSSDGVVFDGRRCASTLDGGVDNDRSSTTAARRTRRPRGGGPTLDHSAPTKSILELAHEEGRLGTFLGLLDTAGLTADVAGRRSVHADRADRRRVQEDGSGDARRDLEEPRGAHASCSTTTSSTDGSPGRPRRRLRADRRGNTIALQATDQFPTLNGQTVIRAGRATNGDDPADRLRAAAGRPQASVGATVSRCAIRVQDGERSARMSGLNSTLGRQRAVGCIVGSAVGDALGAPFEFRSPGEYSARFPQPVHRRHRRDDRQPHVGAGAVHRRHRDGCDRRREPAGLRRHRHRRPTRPVPGVGARRQGRRQPDARGARIVAPAEPMPRAK